MAYRIYLQPRESLNEKRISTRKAILRRKNRSAHIWPLNVDINRPINLPRGWLQENRLLGAGSTTTEYNPCRVGETGPHLDLVTPAQRRSGLGGKLIDSMCVG